MLVAIVALAWCLVFDIHAHFPVLCGSFTDHLPFDAILPSARFLIATDTPLMLLLGWLAMLTAMMTPLIALPLSHVRASSLVARRWRSSAGFLFGYFGVWCLAGVPLLAAAFILRLLADSVLSALLAAALLALIWSASPFQRAAQNRAHRLRRIGLFGLPADRDCIVFGAALGGWCLVSCWAWMLIPLFVPHNHIPAMIAVSAIVMGERLRGPGLVRWRLPAILSPLLTLLWTHFIWGQREGARHYV